LVISPILANVYLHYVNDLWVQRWRRTKANGGVIDRLAQGTLAPCSKWVAFVSCLLLASVANAQPGPSYERVSFRADTTFDAGAQISGELRVPGSAHAQLPAVLILHGSAGVDGRGTSYAEVLNQAGIATLEIEMWRAADGDGRPLSTRLTMPHAYGSLLYLSKHPRIDAVRIGVMGFSWGGIMSGPHEFRRVN
jgi:acetyl esterase/lipase